MKSIKKILVTTDFSESAVSAYIHAQEIASRFGAKIDFVHIIPTLKYFHESLSRMDAPLDADEELYPAAQKEAKHHLQERMKDYISKETRGEEIVKIDRKPSARIVKIAEEGAYDLIVMASKGGDESDLLRGGTTEKVIRHSKVPVFTVDDGLSSDQVETILLPTDGSDISFSALPLALTLASTYGAQISLLHVVELYGNPLENKHPDPNKTEKANLYSSVIDRLEDYLGDSENITLKRGDYDYQDQIVVTDGASSVTIDLFTVIAKGVSAHHGIEDYASENADVVVMATHGHSGLAHFFLGSTTEKVAQHLNIPVLTVKPAEDKLKKK